MNRKWSTYPETEARTNLRSDAAAATGRFRQGGFVQTLQLVVAEDFEDHGLVAVLQNFFFILRWHSTWNKLESSSTACPNWGATTLWVTTLSLTTLGIEENTTVIIITLGEATLSIKHQYAEYCYADCCHTASNVPLD
jgi:hypothetical protein